MEKILKILLWLLLIIGLLYAVIATYVRVYEKGDYLVRYNIPCDPSLEACFSEEICNESGSECETEYYSSIERTKSKLSNMCGSDMSTCAAAETCMEGEDNCAITLCNPDTDICAFPETRPE